jgi:hypothetical protein
VTGWLLGWCLSQEHHLQLSKTACTCCVFIVVSFDHFPGFFAVFFGEFSSIALVLFMDFVGSLLICLVKVWFIFLTLSTCASWIFRIATLDFASYAA